MSEEHVCFALFLDCRRQHVGAEDGVRPQRVELQFVLGILRLDAESELDVRLQVVVAAEDRGGRGEGFDPGDVSGHLISGAFEELADASDEYGVSCEERFIDSDGIHAVFGEELFWLLLLRFEVVEHVAFGVAGRAEDSQPWSVESTAAGRSRWLLRRLLDTAVSSHTGLLLCRR